MGGVEETRRLRAAKCWSCLFATRLALRATLKRVHGSIVVGKQKVQNSVVQRVGHRRSQGSELWKRGPFCKPHRFALANR